MAHPDLDRLLNSLLPFAQQMLARHGEFYPLGSVMTTTGELVASAVYESAENPPSQQIIDALTHAFRAQAAAGEIRAAGICCDMRITLPGQASKSDAIVVSLEHQSGEAIDCGLPYKKGWFGRVQYGALFATPRTASFFAVR
jgi:hypothetical protein